MSYPPPFSAKRPSYPFRPFAMSGNRLLMGMRQTDAMVTKGHGYLRSEYVVPASAGGGQAWLDPPEGGTTNGDRPKDSLFRFFSHKTAIPYQ
jgi:hypothetical protein